MKKFLFTVLVVFNVFMIAGCSDSDDDNGGGGAAFPADLLGTYNVTFFGTQVTNVQPSTYTNLATLLYISNNCAKAKELFPDVINKQEGELTFNQCDAKGQSTLLDGKVVISKNDNGTLAVTSRIQMEGGYVENSKSDKYQYTEYYPTSDFVNYEGKGVKGWNYDSVNNKPSETSTEFPESPYKITKQDDGSLRIDMTLVGKSVSAFSLDMTVDAVTTVIMKKESDSTEALVNKIQQQFQSSSAE